MAFLLGIILSDVASVAPSVALVSAAIIWRYDGARVPLLSRLEGMGTLESDLRRSSDGR